MTNHPGPAAPSPWVMRFASLIAPAGRVLDYACGGGRHARWLAERGYQVEAVDRDADALAALAGLPNLRTRWADLESGPWPYGGCQFDALVVTHYLFRPGLPGLFDLLGPGGVLIYETFMVGNERLGKPSNPDFLLRPGELLDLTRGGFAVVAFEQGTANLPRPAVVQRICAIKGPVGAGTWPLP